MAYQVIARKYRPQRFSDVVGQEHVTQTLANAIERKRIAHAYLFCGPRGTGKTTIARIFAKCLNCTNGPSVDFADDDPRCQEIAEGRSLDVLEIDAASNRGIDEIRGLRETVRYAPATSKFKIYIIDEVHMLTKEAFNALLKTLEEPPEHVKFMFATTEPEKVLVTILSRCQRFDLRRIPAALIVKHLALIAAQEKVTIQDAALYAIARGAEGAMRDAESTLDQLISFCGDKVEEADVLSMFGLTAQNQLRGLTQAVLSGEVENGLRVLNDLAAQGKDLGRLLSDILNHFRNLMIYQVSRGDGSMLELAESEAGALREQAKLASMEGLTRILEVFTDAEMRLREVSSKKILLEVALLKAMEARNAVSLDSVLKRLGELKQANAPGPSVPGKPPETKSTAADEPRAAAPQLAPAAAPPPASAAPMSFAEKPASFTAPVERVIVAAPAAATVPIPPATVAAGPMDSAELEDLWSRLVEGVGRSSPFTRTYLLEAHPVSFARQLFTIGFPAAVEDHLGLVDNPKNQALLQANLAELGFPGVHFKFIKAEPPPGRAPTPVVSPAPAAAPPVPRPRASAASDKQAAAPASPGEAPKPPVALSKEEFKNDPLIRRALEIFKGQIVDVRT